ncbi:MAG TPA: glycosyltransferase family 4 protein [Candidatus Thermoplasmatota archaeon]|nr:glycosyltransferase family 4 protein [Candidatus Thermoplasmatota archaeon]
MSDRIRTVQMPLPTVWQRRQVAALARHGVDVRYVEGFYATSYLPWFQLPREVLRGYDLLHVHWIPFWSKAVLRAFLAAVPRSRPLVWQFHNLWPHRPQFGTEETDIAWTRRCWDRADARLVHSEANVRDFAALGMTGARVLPLGNLHGEFPAQVDRAEARRRLGLPPDATIVGFFGPTGPYKGAATFVEALERAPDVHGLVFGHCPDPLLAAELRAAGARFGDRLRVDLRRIANDELQNHFRACDLVALPYERITTSGSVFFPAAFGVPVVGSPLGNIPDVVRDGETGYLAWGVDGFARVFRETAGRREDLAAMGRKFHEDVGERFDWDPIAKATVEVYRELLDRA